MKMYFKLCRSMATLLYDSTLEVLLSAHVIVTMAKNVKVLLFKQYDRLSQLRKS